jgi:hypothetical protein
MWTCPQKDRHKFWNGFGVLSEAKKLSPNLEINFPLEGIDRRVNGVFLTERDDVAVGYRGHIGGGRKGVGKSLFIRKYSEPLVEIQDGDRLAEVALVERIDSDDLSKRLAWLMKQVIQMKKLRLRKSPTPSEHFIPEFEGPRKPYSISSQIHAVVLHGRIVNALRSQVEELGLYVQRDQAHDLYRIDRSKRMIASFEIKPEYSPYDIYTAIGQLKYHTVGSDAMQFAVLPEYTPRKSLLKLRRLGIESITFAMKDGAVDFHHLARKMKPLLH